MLLNESMFQPMGNNNRDQKNTSEDTASYKVRHAAC